MTKFLTIHCPQQAQRKTNLQPVRDRPQVSATTLEIPLRGQETLRYLNAVFDKVDHRVTETSMRQPIDVSC